MMKWNTNYHTHHMFHPPAEQNIIDAAPSADILCRRCRMTPGGLLIFDRVVSNSFGWKSYEIIEQESNLHAHLIFYPQSPL